MKKILLLFSMFLVLSKVSASDELFPLSGLVPLGDASKATVTYEADYTQVTYNPDAPWNHHSGWNLESAPVDLTGYTHLVFDFESVDVVIGEYGTNVDITVTSAVGNKEMKGSASVTAGRVAVNLTEFTADELASIKRVSIGVWDPDEATAIFNVKKVSLISDTSLFPLVALKSIGGTPVDVSYKPGDEYAQVTYAPDFPWMTQSGWDFGSAPIDLTGYTHLVFDFESVDVVIGEWGTSVEITITSAVGDKEMKGSASVTGGRTVVYLTGFTAEEIASVKRLSIGVWDPDESKAIFNVKKVSLISDTSLFPLVALKSIGGTPVDVSYEPGDEYAQVTYNPDAPWMTQSGWDFGSARLDFTGYTHLVFDFEAIEVNGNVEVKVIAKVGESADKEVNGVASGAAGRIVVNLAGFTAEELASIKTLNIWIWDPDDATAIFKVKEATLFNDWTVSIKNLELDNNALVDVYSITGAKIRTQVNRNEVVKELSNGLYIIGGQKTYINSK